MARQLRKFGRIALVLMAWFVASLPAAAKADEQPSGFTVDEWKVPPTCGDQAHFAILVREAIGEWPANLPEVHVTVTIAKTQQQRWALILSTSAPSGEGLREISGSSCEELLQTAAVVLSLALDSEALYDNELEHTVQTSEERASAPNTVSTGQMGDNETPGLRSRAEEKPASKLDASEALDVSLHLVALSDLGTLPRAALGLGVLASAYSGPYRVSFRLTKWADQVQYVDSLGDRGGNFELLSGSLQLCRELPHNRRLPWGICLQGMLARMSATGIAEEGGTPADAVNVLGSFGAGFYVSLPLKLQLYAESHYQVVRPRYKISPHPTDTEPMDTEVYQPSLLAIRLGLSWGMSF